MTVLQAVYNGKRIQVLDTDKLKDCYKLYVKGELLAMTIERWEDARTRRQQGLAHEMLGRYARATNQAMQWLKDRIKVDLGYWIPMDKIVDGTIDMPDWRGKPVDLHEFYPSLHPELSVILLRSEATYTTRMEGDLIDRIIYECQENGVDIEDILRTLAELNKEG